MFPVSNTNREEVRPLRMSLLITWCYKYHMYIDVFWTISGRNFTLYQLPSTLRRKTEPARICEEDTGPVVLGQLVMRTAASQSGLWWSLKNGAHTKYLWPYSPVCRKHFATVFQDIPVPVATENVLVFWPVVLRRSSFCW